MGEKLLVAATSAFSAWAVGEFSNLQGFPSTLIVRWNGTAWNRVASPNSAGAKFSYLRGVAALSGSSAWAVGNSDPNGTFVTLIEHWNGKAWKTVPSPSP